MALSRDPDTGWLAMLGLLADRGSVELVGDKLCISPGLRVVERLLAGLVRSDAFGQAEEIFRHVRAPRLVAAF